MPSVKLVWLALRDKPQNNTAFSPGRPGGMEGTPKFNEEFPAPARAGVKPDPLDSPSGPNYSNVYIKRENARSSACTESSIVQRLFEPASPLKVEKKEKLDPSTVEVPYASMVNAELPTAPSYRGPLCVRCGLFGAHAAGPCPARPALARKRGTATLSASEVVAVPSKPLGIPSSTQSPPAFTAAETPAALSGSSSAPPAAHDIVKTEIKCTQVKEEDDDAIEWVPTPASPVKSDNTLHRQGYLRPAVLEEDCAEAEDDDVVEWVPTPATPVKSEHKARGSRKKRPPVHKEPTVDEEDDVVEWVPLPPPTAKPADAPPQPSSAGSPSRRVVRAKAAIVKPSSSTPTANAAGDMEPEGGAHVCPDCDEGFDTPQLLTAHVSLERPFPCPHCDHRSKTRAHRTMHIVTHTRLRDFSCKLCGNAYAQRSGCREHIKKAHMDVLDGRKPGSFVRKPPKARKTEKGSEREEDDESEDNVVSSEQEEEEGVPPPPPPTAIEPSGSPSFDAAQVSAAMAGTDQEVESGGGVVKGERKGGVCGSREKKVEGAAEDEEYSDDSEGEEDEEYTGDSGSDEEDEEWDDEEAQTGRTQPASKPVSNKVEREKPSPSPAKKHVCGECGTRFATRAYLLRHHLIHTGEKPHACPECGKRFTRKYNMEQHAVGHTGRWPWSCGVCDKPFFHRPLCRSHIKHAHADKCKDGLSPKDFVVAHDSDDSSSSSSGFSALKCRLGARRGHYADSDSDSDSHRKTGMKTRRR